MRRWRYRIAELYPELPKLVVPVRDHPFLPWVTGWLAGRDITDIIYSVGYRAEQIERWMEAARQLECRPQGRPRERSNAGLYLLSRSLLKNFPRNRKLSMEEEILPSPICQGVNLTCEVAENAPFLVLEHRKRRSGGDFCTPVSDCRKPLTCVPTPWIIWEITRKDDQVLRGQP